MTKTKMGSMTRTLYVYLVMNAMRNPKIRPIRMPPNATTKKEMKPKMMPVL